MGSCSSSKKKNAQNSTGTQPQNPPAPNLIVTQKQPEVSDVNCDKSNNQKVLKIEPDGRLLKPGEKGFNGDENDNQDHTIDYRKKNTKKGGNVD